MRPPTVRTPVVFPAIWLTASGGTTLVCGSLSDDDHHTRCRQNNQLDIHTLFHELLVRFPSVTRIESGTASYGWLSAYASELQVFEDVELLPDQLVLMDEEGNHLVTVDVIHLPEK